MFTEVRQALLPLALRRDTSRWDDLGRARLLLDSLARHWSDPRPLALLVVAPPRDVDALMSGLPRAANIELSVRAESDFFRAPSGFHMMRGWHRQQIVKLHVPAMLGFAGYLTLDADVCCVGDFDATSFVKDGRALSQWGLKERHHWWQQTARVVGSHYDPTERGLTVTPNILHGTLAAQTLDHFRGGAFGPLVTLAGWLLRRPGVTPWTEYSLYTCVAELKGNLLAYHQPWSAANDTPLLSYDHSIWHRTQTDRLALYTPANRPEAPFVVLQGSTGVSLQRVKEAIGRLG